MGSPRFEFDGEKIMDSVYNKTDLEKREKIDRLVYQSIDKLFEDANQDFGIKNPYWNEEDPLYTGARLRLRAMILDWIDENRGAA